MSKMIQYIPYLLDVINSLASVLRKQDKKDEQMQNLRQSLDALQSGAMDLQRWVEQRERRLIRIHYWLVALSIFGFVQTLLVLYLIFAR